MSRPVGASTVPRPCTVCGHVGTRVVGTLCSRCAKQRQPTKTEKVKGLYAEHRRKLADIRKRLGGRSPYEVAVAQVEASSGKPRTTWEHIIGHPLVLEANRLARGLAGVSEDRLPGRVA